MKFQKFPSLTNSYAEKFVTKVMMQLKDVKTKWVVTEKIHGANYSFWFDGVENFRPAKRTCFIEEETNFFGQKFVIEKYKDSFIKAAKKLYPGKVVALYGEICGGSDTEYQRPVQVEVYYFDHIEFLGFTLYVDDVLQDHYAMEALAKEAGIPVVPCLGIFDTLSEALNVNYTFNSLISGKDDNVCEGTVVAPLEPIVMECGSRPVFKQKNDKFKEKSQESKPKKKGIVVPEEFLKLFESLISMVNINRFDNMASKLESEELVFQNFNKLLGMYVEDILEEYQRENDTKLPKEVVEKVRRPIFAESAKVVKEGLIKHT